MGQEIIEVRYKPIYVEVTIGGVTVRKFTGFYHKYIVYTDSNGVEHYVRGDPEVGDGYTTRHPDAETNVNVDRPFGELTTESGVYEDSPTNPDWDDPLDDIEHGSETIKTGEDLSEDWGKIKKAMGDIAAEGHNYAGTSKNSNSAVDTALDRSGLDQPERDDCNYDDPVWGQSYYAPGSGTMLPEGVKPDYDDLVTPILNLANYLAAIQLKIMMGWFGISPLVLDLGEQGIDLGSTVYWDIDRDGMKEATSWTNGEDGLLAYDRNGDGFVTDHSELFGTEVDDGFLILAEFDYNGDGVINSSDTAFQDLIVWVDANTDGYSQEGEMYSLTDLGITSINLNASAVSYEIDGNTISSESTFTMNGETRTIVDAWFNYDDTNSVYDGEYTLDVRTLFLPVVRGYGDLPDLYISMSMDNGTGGLLEMVQANDNTLGCNGHRIAA